MLSDGRVIENGLLLFCVRGWVVDDQSVLVVIVQLDSQYCFSVEIVVCVL